MCRFLKVFPKKQTIEIKKYWKGVGKKTRIFVMFSSNFVTMGGLQKQYTSMSARPFRLQGYTGFVGSPRTQGSQRQQWSCTVQCLIVYRV